MENDVTTTLSELERKLKELERELESVGRGGELDADPAQSGWTPAPDPAEELAPGPGPPPPGATPFTAVWHGGAGEGATPPPLPVSAHNGAPPVPVPPPEASWGQAPPAPPLSAPPRQPPPPPAGRSPAPWGQASPVPAPGSSATAGLHQQLDELFAFRDRLVRTTDDLVSELSRVLTELGVGAAVDPADTLLTGDVTVEAAPFADLATLAAFEQALARVPGVARVYTRRLDAGHATIDVRLMVPVALGAALRAISPVAFAVTDVRDGRLALALA